MGALNSRRASMADDDFSGFSPNFSSESSDESDTDSENESTSFVLILQNLISSGQLVLQNVTFDPGYGMKQKVPKVPKPNVSVLSKSQFSLATQQASGLSDPRFRHLKNSKNVTSLLFNRERGIYGGNNFPYPTRCSVASNYLPNQFKHSLDDHSNGKVFCGIFTKDGTKFLTASQDRNIRLYNSGDGSYKMYKTIPARDVGWSIIDVALSPDNRRFVYSTWSSSLHMCSLDERSEHQEPLTLVNTARRFCIFSIMYSSAGDELLGGANDGCLYIYDLERNMRSLKIPAHDLDVNSVKFADETSHIIYSGGDDGLIKVWDRRTLNEESPTPVGVLAGHMDGITFIDSRGDGRHLISNSKDQSIKLWDVRVFSGEKAAERSLKSSQEQTWDYRWQEVPQKLHSRTKLEGDTSIMTYRGHVVIKTLIRCRFSPQATTGQRYIYTGCGTGRIVIYDSLTGKIMKSSSDLKSYGNHSECVRDVSWHPSRNEILSSSWDGMVNKWSYFNHKPVVDNLDKREKRKSKNGSEPPRRSLRLAMKRKNYTD